ncbi:MAG: hypothetical protein GC160_20735 [Acidobacteria bacterium]|nr:hypothetical protein [Acidobacteriota bacterium]
MISGKLCLFLALPLLLAAQPAPQAGLQVSRVALYKHGVAYFEVAGEIADGQTARLEFKASEMDDVLKSLTIRRQGGDGVSAIQYDSADPLEKRLENFSFRLGEHASLAEVLDQFRGASLTVEQESGAAQGLIVSARSASGADGAELQELLLATASGGLRTLDPRRAVELRFREPDLQRRFLDYLGVVAQSRNADRRGLTIQSRGGSSHIAAAYLAPAPVWKSSYRLILPEDGEPLLEGWAVVDNTSAEDWTDVRLSLVSGLPVSFLSSLYEPRYVARPRVELRQDRAWQPILHGAAVDVLPAGNRRSAADGPGRPATGSIQGTVMDSSGAVIPMAMIRVAGPGSQSYSATSAPDGGFRIADLPAGTYQVSVASAGFRQYSTRVDVGSGAALLSVILEIGSVTETVAVMNTEMSSTSVVSDGSTVQENLFAGEQLGDLFQYSIREPVTVRAGQSAMLPFFSGRVQARRLLIYSESYGSQHPLQAVRIVNETDGALDGGAITVYDSGGYGGEGVMETVKAGDDRLISYAVDLGTRITSAFHSEATPMAELHAKDGLLLTKRLTRERKTFTVRNVDPDAKTLWLELPVRQGFEPVGAEPVEKTAAAWRFEAELEPKAVREVALLFERVDQTSVELTQLSADGVRYYAESPVYDAAGRQQLLEVARRLAEVEQLYRESERLEDEADTLSEGQGRLRENIETLNALPGQSARVQELADRLTANEDRILELEKQSEQVEERADALQERIERDIERLAF